MSVNPMQEPFFGQNFAFSTNYLDYEIPDFRGIINAAIPVLVYQGAVLSIIEGSLRPLDAQTLGTWIADIRSRSAKLICNDAVSFHRVALSMAGDDADLKESVWQLTDTCSLWDVCLMEQRLIWAIEGQAVDRPGFEPLLEKYHVSATLSSLDGLREIFQSQFNRLVDGLPFLGNDIAGRRVFDPTPQDSTIIPAPTRVLARDVDYRERLHVFMPLLKGWKKYGPACIGLDVQSAIAVHYQNENRCDAATDAVRQYQKKKIELWERLVTDRLEDCYETLDRGHEDGSPIYNEKSIKKKLRKHWRATTPARQELEAPIDNLRFAIDGTEDVWDTEKLSRFFWKKQYGREKPLSQWLSGQPRSFPCQNDGQITLIPAHWGETLPPNGPLRNWADYHAASQMVHFAETPDANLPHESFPYLKSIAAEYADRENLPLLASPPGRRFLTFRIHDLDLLCYLRTHGEYEFIRKDYNDASKVSEDDLLAQWDDLQACLDKTGLVDKCLSVSACIEEDEPIVEEFFPAGVYPEGFRGSLSEIFKFYLDDIKILKGGEILLREGGENIDWDAFNDLADVICKRMDIRQMLTWDRLQPHLDRLYFLNCFVGNIDLTNFTTSTEWHVEDFIEFLPLPHSSKHEKLSLQRQYTDVSNSLAYWEASPFYIVYQFFAKPQHERDSFLAAICLFARENKFIDMDRYRAFFYAIARRSIEGFIHGWPAKVVAKQLRSEYTGDIPEHIRNNDFFQEIERLYGRLLNSFRFRGLIHPFLLTSLLPKLCIDPVMRPAPLLNGESIELCIDGAWCQDHPVRHDWIEDPMARDAIVDVTDRKIIQGETKGRQEKERWYQFLSPLLDERCRELGISELVPGDELFSRLYTTSTISRNGKPGRPIYEIEKPYTCWMETLDDLKKAVAYALVRAGEKLVAVSEDAFVLEVSENISPESIQVIVDRVRRVCEDVLGLEADTWGNFVEFEQSAVWPAPNSSE